MFSKTLTAAAFGALLIAAPAANAAVVIPLCNNTDITPTAQQCVGYAQGNLLNNANLAAQTSALATLGLTWNGITLEKLEPGANPANFATALNGVTYIGIHYGRGQGPVSVPGGVTAFYRFDAGVNADTFGINPGSISGVSLYSTGLAGVPEPATWAMMIFGFGLIGGALRSRKAQATRVTYA